MEYAESELDDRESLYFDTLSLAESEAAAVAAATAAAAAAATAQRRSLSQSRNTVYHSAVDLATTMVEDQVTPARKILPEIFIEPPQPDYQYVNGKNANGINLPPYRYPAPIVGPSYLAVNGYSQAPIASNLAFMNMSGSALSTYTPDYWNAQALAAQVAALQQQNVAPLPGYRPISWPNIKAEEEAIGPILTVQMPPIASNQIEPLQISLKGSQTTTTNETHKKTKKMPITYSQWKFRVRNCSFHYHK